MSRSRVLLAFVLSLSLIVAPSFAAVKAGAKCTKAGKTSTASGKKFTCVKSGNKLVWNKGVAIKAAPKPDLNPVFKPVEPTPTPTPTATPTPIATPTPTPTPTPTSTYLGPRDIFGTPTSEEALIIDKLVDIAWDKGKPATQFVVSTVNDRVKGTTWSNDNAAMLPAITRILDGVGAPLTRKVDWYVWWDLQSLTPLLPPNCWAKDTRFFDAKAVGAGYCRPSTIFIFFEAYQQWYPKEGFLEKYPNEWDKYGIAAVTAGEVVHFSQQTYGEKFGHEAFNFYPAWLREGPSILYSAMAYAKHMNMPYSTVRNLALQHFKNYKCGEVLLTDLLMFNQSDRFCEYSGGLLASEYMIAKSGDVLAPFRYLESKMKGDGEQCQNPHRICRPSYESVIREIYSNDVDAWHAELQKYIVKWAYTP
jgi:hypothetical protein